MKDKVKHRRNADAVEKDRKPRPLPIEIGFGHQKNRNGDGNVHEHHFNNIALIALRGVTHHRFCGKERAEILIGELCGGGVKIDEIGNRSCKKED